MRLPFKINKPIVFLIVFVVLLFEAFLPKNFDNFYTDLVLRLFRHTVLFLYYFYSCKNKAIEIIIMIVLSFISGVFISFDVFYLGGLTFLIIYKLLLVNYSYKRIKNKNITFKLLIPVFLMFLGIVSFVLYANYNTLKTVYIIIAEGGISVVLLTLSYVNLLDNSKNGNLKYFIAFSVFSFSDTLFVLDLLKQNNYLLLTILTLLYNFGYFLVVQSDIESKRALC